MATNKYFKQYKELRDDIEREYGKRDMKQILKMEDYIDDISMIQGFKHVSNGSVKSLKIAKELFDRGCRIKENLAEDIFEDIESESIELIPDTPGISYLVHQICSSDYKMIKERYTSEDEDE